MGVIKGLCYVGIGADDLEAWRTFGADVLGLQETDGPAAGEADAPDAVYFRMDGRAYRLAVEAGKSGSVQYLGFEVATVAELDALASELGGKGLPITAEAPELCARRRVVAMYSTVDPNGHRVEFVVGHEESAAPFVSPRGANFVTGDMGIGHCFMFVNDVDEFVTFYVDTLGFRVSDTAGLAGGNLGYFLHCNPRHHSLAGLAVAGVPAALHHVMLEVDSIDTVGAAFDRALASGAAIQGTIGKHSNDHVVSFMVTTPSGVNIEYGTGGRRVDDETWVVGHYTNSSVWGHARPGIDITLELLND